MTTNGERGEHSSSILSFDMMRRDERRSPMGPPFISFRLLSEGGLGAPGTEVQGFAGNRAPSPCRRLAENSLGLGAKGTESQGLAGYCAPSPGRRSIENSPGFGAPGTEVQGFAGNRAPSPRRRLAENSPGLGAPGMEVQGFAGYRAPSPGRPVSGGGAGPIRLSALRTYNPICLEI